MFDARAAYDARALGTRYGGTLRRPAPERTLENKNKAISFAAYATLVDLFPSRHEDGSNQLGGYANITGYQPVNDWNRVVDRWRWQPLRVPLEDPNGTVQRALTPQWAEVVPFGMSSQYGLDDPSKIKAEYWADGPHSEFPPGHWAIFAQAISRKRGHSLDDDVKLFFTLGNALTDASIAAGAQVIRTLVGSDSFGASVTDDAGMSRRYGGIHLGSGDLHGRSLGATVGADAWVKARPTSGRSTPGRS
jgi:hypothetical protein